jgi:hypothetical protein
VRFALDPAFPVDGNDFGFGPDGTHERYCLTGLA